MIETSQQQFIDSVFGIRDLADPSKFGQFDASAISADTARVLAFPNASGTIALEEWVDGNFLSLDGEGSDVINGTFNLTTTGAIQGSGLTLTDLSVSRLTATDASKTLVSSDLYSWVTETSNQVLIADDGDGTITFSLPQNIHTGATPTFAGLTLSGLTATRLMASDGAKGLASVADLTSWIAGATDHIDIANDGDGTVTIDLGANTQNLLDHFNGTFIEKFDFTISESGGTVTGSLEKQGGGDLIQRFSDGYTTLDTTPAKTINLTAFVGTDSAPKEVFVYILKSDKNTIVASNSDWPTAEHEKVANLLLRSAATTGTDDGALVNHNWNDHASDENNQGMVTHIEERLRQEPTQWKSGIALTLKNSAGNALTTGNSSIAVELVTTAGKTYQLHKQTFPAFDMFVNAADDVHIVNQPAGDGGPYVTTADLVGSIVSVADGTPIGTNKYFNLIIWGVQNRSGEASHIMVNLPTDQYNTEAAAISDTNAFSIFSIPSIFKGEGFLIARLTFRLIAGSQWTFIAEEDLRGQVPPTAAGISLTTTDHALLSNLGFASAGHTGFQAQGDVLDDLNTVGVNAADSEFLVGTGAGALTWESGNTVRTSLGLSIGSDVQAYDDELASLAGLTYAAASFVKMTGAGTFALRTIAQTADDLEGTIDHANLANLTIVAHDTTATGANLTALTDNSIVNTLHRHSELVSSDGTPDPALSVDATGLVGIGTENPAQSLDINGNLRVGYGSGFNAYMEIRTSPNDVLFSFKGNDDVTRWEIRDDRGVLDFNAGDSGPGVMHFISDGKIGMGTPTPKTKLTIAGTITILEQAAADGSTAAYGQLWVKNTDPTELWFTDDTGVDHQIAYV